MKVPARKRGTGGGGVGVGAACRPYVLSPPSPARPCVPHAAGRAAAERGALTFYPAR